MSGKISGCQDVDSKLGGYKIWKNTPVIYAVGVRFQNEKYFPNPKRNKEDARRCDIDCALRSCVVPGWDILLHV